MERGVKGRFEEDTRKRREAERRQKERERELNERFRKGQRDGRLAAPDAACRRWALSHLVGECQWGSFAVATCRNGWMRNSRRCRKARRRLVICLSEVRVLAWGENGNSGV